MKTTTWSAGLSVSGDGTGVVAHAGNVAVRLLADRTGLTDALSAALARRVHPGHDRGRVLVDVATMIAGGGEAIADIDTSRHQGEVLGAVASPPTVWRALDELSPAVLRRVAAARGKTRAGGVVGVWSLIPGGDTATPLNLAIPLVCGLADFGGPRNGYCHETGAAAALLLGRLGVDVARQRAGHQGLPRVAGRLRCRCARGCGSSSHWRPGL